VQLGVVIRVEIGLHGVEHHGREGIGDVVAIELDAGRFEGGLRRDGLTAPEDGARRVVEQGEVKAPCHLGANLLHLVDQVDRLGLCNGGALLGVEVDVGGKQAGRILRVGRAPLIADLDFDLVAGQGHQGKGHGGVAADVEGDGEEAPAIDVVQGRPRGRALSGRGRLGGERLGAIGKILVKNPGRIKGVEFLDDLSSDAEPELRREIGVLGCECASDIESGSGVDKDVAQEVALPGNGVGDCAIGLVRSNPPEFDDAVGVIRVPPPGGPPEAALGRPREMLVRDALGREIDERASRHCEKEKIL